MMLMKGEDDQHNDNANDGDYDQGNSNYKKGNKKIRNKSGLLPNPPRTPPRFFVKKYHVFVAIFNSFFI